MDIMNTQNKKQYVNKLENYYLAFDRKEQETNDLGKMKLALEGKLMVIAILRTIKKENSKKRISQ